MKQTLAFIAMASLLVLASSCGFSTDSTRAPVGGHLGIDIFFEQGYPPEKIYESHEFPVEIRLRNTGGHTIPGGALELYLTGYDPNMINGLVRNKKVGDPLEKASNEYAYETYVSMGEGRINKGIFDDYLTEINPVLQITACYPYKTYASAEVCINPDIYDTPDRKQECISGVRQITNTPGPVAVSAVTLIPLSMQDNLLEVRFDITVTNRGPGTVWLADDNKYLYECGHFTSTPQGLRDIRNRVKITKVSINEDELDCFDERGAQVIELIGSSKRFTCKGRVRANAAYTTLLTMEFDYGYAVSRSKTVKILSDENKIR